MAAHGPNGRYVLIRSSCASSHAEPTERGARLRASRIQNRGAVGMARLLLLKAVVFRLSPVLLPLQYKFHATYGPRWPAWLRSLWGAPWPRGSCLSRGLAGSRTSPQTPGCYRGDNITMIPGQRLSQSKSPGIQHERLFIWMVGVKI